MAKRVPPSFLQGILSLFSKMTPEWLTNLIDKTKGADKYVKKITEPYDAQKILRNKLDEYMARVGKGEYLGKSYEEIQQIEDLDTLSRLRLKDAIAAGFSIEDWITAREAPGIHYLNFTDENPTVKIDDLWDLDFDQAKRLGYSNKEWQDAQDVRLLERDAAGNFIGEENWELVPEHLRPLEHQTSEYSKSLKDQIKKEKEKKIKRGRFTLIEGGKDDDLARGGIAGFAPGGIKIRTPKLHDIGLMKSLLKLGTTMGYSEKELLEMAIKFNWDVSDKLKKQYGITDESLKAKSDKGLEWLLLKANPDLANQPYSKSKVNKMLSEGLEDEVENPFGSDQLDLFKKKTGGLVSLVNG